MPPESGIPNPANLQFTFHAHKAMAEREIRVEWVLRTVENPEFRSVDSADSDLERFFCHIPERGGRVLRVVVNTRVYPWRIITVFFDRKMKGKT